MDNCEKKYILGFDIGTSGVKCIALDTVSGAYNTVYTQWDLRSPIHGYAEFDCDELWQCIVASVCKLRDEHGVDLSMVASIGFCALCPGLIPLDEHGRELYNCIIFMDTRSGRETAEINSRISPRESFDILANRIMSGATSVTSMLWLKNNCREIYEKTAAFVHLPGWAGYKLTGKLCMDLSNAAGTGLYDIHRQCWSEKLADAAGIDLKKLPKLAQGADLLGGVQCEEFIKLGIPAGTPVSCGAGDTVCALLALFGRKSGGTMLMLGTSNVLFTISDNDSFSDKLQGRSFVFGDQWALGGAMSGPGAMQKWFKNKFCPDCVKIEHETGISAYSTIDAEAAATPPGADGLICLPYINGERSPVYDSNARAVLIGVNLNTTRGHVARAITEGAAYGIRQFIDLLYECTGSKPKELSVLGGGSRSDFVVQTMANVTGCVMNTFDNPDLGALGAAITGGLAGGVIDESYTAPCIVKLKTFTPDTSLSEVYKSGFKRYCKIYPAVKDIF